MNHFDRIHVQGFRRLVDLDLELRPLNVLIGANGSGKTSLLDVFSLLSASASGGLNAKLSELGGIMSNLSLGRSQQLSFGLSTPTPEFKPVTYDLTIAPKGLAYEISSEKLFFELYRIDSTNGFVNYWNEFDKSVIRPTWEYNLFETALSQVPKMLSATETYRRGLASSAYYHTLDVGPRAPVRLPQPLRPATLPGKDGEDLISFLFYLRETDRDRFEAIEDSLRTAFPGFIRLDFPPVAAGTLAMTWRDSHFAHPFYMHQLSEGTLRFLWLVTLLHSPWLTGVTLLDEPEVSLHPELLNLLAGLMREATARTQLIVATHSDRLIRFLEPSEVVTFDLDEDGAVRAQRADQLDIDEWLKEYTLDEVWRLGRIGGRA